MAVKDNQPQVLEDVLRLFADPGAGGCDRDLRPHGSARATAGWRYAACGAAPRWSATATGRGWPKRSVWSGRWCGSTPARCGGNGPMP